MIDETGTHEFYYEPKPEYPLRLSNRQVWDVVRTEVEHRPDAGIVFMHYVREKS